MNKEQLNCLEIDFQQIKIKQNEYIRLIKSKRNSNKGDLESLERDILSLNKELVEKYNLKNYDISINFVINDFNYFNSCIDSIILKQKNK